MYEKLLGRDTLRIGAIGGSITAGFWAYPSDNCYESKLCYFLQKRYPDNVFVPLNAGSGGTSSRFGCARVKNDLLEKKPDLIIIEFAVNDEPSDSAAFEGLVRQCVNGTDGPVILLCMMVRSGSDSTQMMQSRIGAHYDLPVISYRNAVWPLVKSGVVPWDSLAEDYVHPNNNGHLVCAHLLYSFLTAMLRDSSTSGDESLAIPGYLVSDFYDHAGIHDRSDALIQESQRHGWMPITKEYGRLGYASNHVSDSLSLVTSAREVTIGYYASENRHGSLQAIVDRTLVDTISNHFAGGERMRYYSFFRDDVRQRHLIELVNLSADEFKLDYLLLTP